MTEILMPRVGATMEEGKVLRWLKSQGDAVRAGEELLEIETDKANVIIEAPKDGVLREVWIDAGTVAAVGTVLGVIAGPGEP